MLYYKTLDKPTLELLKQLMALPPFENMCLCGGTSLALQIGHRKSIDIDLFGQVELDYIAISKALASVGTIQTIKHTQNINIYIINGIKVDIVNYHYPWIGSVITEDFIRLGSKQDIAAMKLAAITGRGSKKDFIDLYFLLEEYTMMDMLKFYNQKYSDGSIFMVLKSLVYFDDAEKDPEPIMLKPLQWQDVKIRIKKEVERYLSQSGYNP